MSTAAAEATTAPTLLAEPPNLDALIARLGDIPLSRVLAQPAPGSATEADAVEAQRRYGRLHELVDGVLVEKGMEYRESLLAIYLGRILLNFVEQRNLGVVSGADGTVRLFAGLLRIPDVAFASWDRFPERKIPKDPIPSLAPDLAIEVLSESNTKGEMERKRRDYFSSGVRLVWEVDPESRRVTVYTPDLVGRVLEASETLDGAAVLPGFALKLSDLFDQLDRHG
jgi:Uma2 family endonuclease